MINRTKNRNGKPGSPQKCDSKLNEGSATFLKSKKECACNLAHSFLLFGWIPKEGDSPSWPEESKETGGFVAGNPTGTASPWHTTLLAKSSVLYLCEGAGGGRPVLPEGIGQKKTGAAGIAERLQRKAAAWASTRAKGYRSRCASLPSLLERPALHQSVVSL